MPMLTQDVRQTLLARNPEFRQLFEEHSRCDIRLKQILRRFTSVRKILFKRRF